ncbi:hypothetical protein [Streptomyces marincola]|uniref:Secreted protein n=1 Tax=Streptomyces marincola TaxID=2878388 RepID=A0A1W7D3X4_9ACTN|nr:hypothetical protein [Streptomyces marincola]ARQ71637.1 hypothetical protein CAG99_24900 [Streptomyces marincola]
MQLRPGPGPTGLPHTRARARHWLIVAAALAVVTGAAALVRPPGATATPDAPVAGPDPAAVSYPVDCGPLGVVVADRAETDFDADGRAETVAVVHCDAGSGTPPHGVYLVTHPAEGEGAPRVAETLVDPGEGMTVDGLDVRDGAVSARLRGYSAPDVPRCCPDLRRDVSWAWRDGRLELSVAPAPGSI